MPSISGIRCAACAGRNGCRTENPDIRKKQVTVARQLAELERPLFTTSAEDQLPDCSFVIAGAAVCWLCCCCSANGATWAIGLTVTLPKNVAARNPAAARVNTMAAAIPGDDIRIRLVMFGNMYGFPAHLQGASLSFRRLCSPQCAARQLGTLDSSLPGVDRVCQIGFAPRAVPAFSAFRDRASSNRKSE